LLLTYEAERRSFARQVIRMAIGIGWAMTGGTALTSRVRRAAIRTVTRVPGIEDKIMNAAMPTFPDGPLRARGDRAAGRLCRQPRVSTDGRTALLDDVLGDGFAVISQGHDATAAFDAETRTWFDRLGLRVLHLDGAGTVDTDGMLRELLDNAKSDALLIRRDRVILASSDRADLRAWRGLLERAGIGGGPHD
jgi:3-(3-hydroxy-phenyl)propionate hydroxylase